MVEHAEMNQMVTAVIAALGSMENTAKVSFIEPVKRHEVVCVLFDGSYITSL